MRQGKIPYQTLERCVWKHTGKNQPFVRRGSGPGNDCAIFSPEDASAILTAQHSFVWKDEWAFQAAFYRVLGDLAAAGGRAELLQLSLVLPLSAEESELRGMMEAVNRLAGAEGLELVGGHTMSAAEVTETIATLNVTGRPIAEQGEMPGERKPAAGQALVAAGFIGMEGTALLTLRNRERLSAHYTDGFLIGAERFLQELSVAPEAAVAIQHGAIAMHNGAEGGIFGALWEFAERGKLGFEIDLKAIPICQETIEICEFLRKNPYELASGGLLLIAADNGEAMTAALRKENIPAVMIGHFTKGPARILYNDGETRYLDLPKEDAVWG